VTADLQPTGPFLQTALICEKVLQEPDGVLSAIRIIDRIIHTIQGPMPVDPPRIQFHFVFLITFKSGRARGRHQIEVVSEHPSGRRTNIFTTSALFEGEDRGQNLVLQTGAEFDAEGLYWYDVILDDKLITRIPFRVIYQLLSTGD
jgi:hypothetical protein